MSDAVRVEKTTAVVVTYQPCLDLLQGVLEGVQHQVGQVVVVDNGSDAQTQHWLNTWQKAAPGRLLKCNNTNLGIAAAINQGTDEARKHGATCVLLLDQDSHVGPGMVIALHEALVRESGKGVPVAAAGPVFVDRRTGQPAPFVRIGWLLNRKVLAPPGTVVDTDFLISSGCLIPVAMLAQLGGMYEPLFIDNVDLEWSFRARAAGCRLIGVGQARMEHAIGDRVMSLGRGSKALVFSLHGPLRLYYMTRNRIWLYRQSSTPLAWVTQDIPRLLLKAVGMSLFAAPRWANAKAMLRGGLDGVRNQLGICRH